jgi:hypothetical protein
MRMGEHLQNLQMVLEGKGLFVKYLETLHFSYRTAYRYIEAYKAVKDQVPETVLQLAAARGMDLVGYQADRPFGPYTEAIKALPPPAEAEKVPEWLDGLEEKRKELPKRARNHKPAPAEASLRMAFASVYSRFKSLPNGKGRVAWSKRLIGLLMAEFGLPAQHFEPEAVPDGFRPKVGRPKRKGSRRVIALQEDSCRPKRNPTSLLRLLGFWVWFYVLYVYRVLQVSRTG